MSMQTWMEEFYPVEAEKVPAAQAVAHSLRKWRGLRPDNMKRHGVFWGYKHTLNYITDAGGYCLFIDAGSCALCWTHVNLTGSCASCPLSIARHGHPCDYKRPAEALSPWAAGSGKMKNVEPMIYWLEEAAQTQKEL